MGNVILSRCCLLRLLEAVGVVCSCFDKCKKGRPGQNGEIIYAYISLSILENFKA
jgi:hypothetical protein